MVALGDGATWAAARLLARDLRRAGLRVLTDFGGRSSKSQMKRANRSGARHMLIVGDDELAAGEVTVKEMATSRQRRAARGAVAAALADDGV